MIHGHTQRIWGERPGMNGDKDHWQDAQELADVAASVMGVRLEIIRRQEGEAPAPAIRQPMACVPLSAMGGR